MEESDTFMAILEEGEEKGLKMGLEKGRQEEAKNVLLRQGKKRFGVPDEAIAARLMEIMDLEHLHRLADRMFEATSWQDLLATP